MRNILKEPLLHFLLIGAAIFFIYGMANETDTEEPDRKIVVSAGRIEQLLTVFQKTWQRPPTREELQGLINDFLLEEVYYRRSVAMGIDRDDTIIRRRLRQKLEFLTDDTASLVEASDEDLSAYLVANEDKFRESPTYTFRQAYFNPEKHGDDPEAYVEEQLGVLRSGTANAIIGGLFQHRISFTGQSGRDEVNLTNLQYFCFLNFEGVWQVGGSPTIKANWEADSDDTWNVPIGLGVQKLLFLGKLPVKTGIQFDRGLKESVVSTSGCTSASRRRWTGRP